MNNGTPSLENHLAAQLAPQMGHVAQPTLSLHMSGFMHLQVPATKETQQIFDLLPPQLKQEPHKSAVIVEEAKKAEQFAAQHFTVMFQNSPQLRPQHNPVQLRCSFAIVDGKLYYVYMVPVRSA
jgi:hypothetical protein